MTRGGGGEGMKILRGGPENFQTPERGALKKLGGGGAPKICILLAQKEGGAPKILNR